MVTQSHPTVCNPMDSAHQASLSITNSRSLLKLVSIELVMPFSHLILCHPLLLPIFNLSQHQGLFRSVLCIRWPKHWSFSISPSNEYSGLISFRIDWLDLFAVQKDSQEYSPAPWSNSINSLVLNLFYCPTLTFVYDYWKNHSFDYMDF